MSIDFLENSRYSGKPITFFLIEGGGDNLEETKIGPYAFSDGEEVLSFPWMTRMVNGVETEIKFIPWPIKSTDISNDGTLDKSDITVTMALGSAMDDMFLAYPPSQVVNLSVFQGHYGDEMIPSNYPAKWIGRILTGAREENEMMLNCQPVSSSVKRPGLRRNYQIGCPHVLYGTQCRASRSAATVRRPVDAVNRNVIRLAQTIGVNQRLYLGGLVEWKNNRNGTAEIRTISYISPDGIDVSIRGVMRGLAGGGEVKLIRGCDRLMSGCSTHSNILNYGGQPFIPLENPLSTKNQFY